VEYVIFDDEEYVKNFELLDKHLKGVLEELAL